MMNDTQQLVQQFRQKQSNQNNAPERRKNVFDILFTVFIAIVLLAAFINRQSLIDQYTVATFKPTAEVVGIANRAGLNDRGKYYLYASRTEIDDRPAFNQACSKLLNEKTVVLGCYTGAQKRIFVFNVTDATLDGVEEVTAAHEMLHAVYDRLPSPEKNRVDKLLLAQEKTITDKRITDLIAEYKQAEPTEIVNELHSIFGTEVRNLSPELETYYRQYFTDRSATVGLLEKYESVFTGLEQRQVQLVDELNSLANDVNTHQNQYQADLASLNADIASFNSWALSATASRSEYNSRRATLEERIRLLDASRNEINAEISDYNVKKAELDKLNIQAQSLNQSIDSKLLPSAPTL